MDYTVAFNAFAGTLVNHLIASNNTGNLLVSPLSISTCLGLLLLGCRNNSSEQLMNVLRFKTGSVSDVDSRSIFSSYHQLLANFQDQDRKDQVILLNKAFTYPGAEVLPEYREQLQSYFMAQIEDLNSTSNVEINDWVRNSTNGRITSIMDSPPDPLDRLSLLNVVYFKGTWTYQFPKAATAEDFFLVNGNLANKQLVEFMNLPRTKLNYSEFIFSDDKIAVQAVELPYAGSSSMVIFLPIDHHSLDALLAPGPESLGSLVQNFDSSKRRQEVLVALPKFKFEKELDLISTLSELGATDVVDPSLADLSGIDGTRDLYVSKLKHKAAIDLNEEGVEAAGVTHLTVSMRSFTFVNEFIANRPFLFVIRDHISNLILFVGKYTEP